MKSSSIISFCLIFAMECFTPCQSQCEILVPNSYMNFVVRVRDHKQGETWSTGSVLTPNVVIGLCTRYLDPRKNRFELRIAVNPEDFVVHSTPQLLPKTKGEKHKDRPFDVLSHHFSQGTKKDGKACIEEYKVTDIFQHPWCEKKDAFRPSKYNFAAFVVKPRFATKDEDVLPLMPISEDIHSVLVAIDRFNSKGRARCQVAQYGPDENAYPTFLAQNAFRSVPMQSECLEAVCFDLYHRQDQENKNTARYDYCKFLMTYPEGSMLCATRVKQKYFMEGITYYDYYNLDEDYVTGKARDALCAYDYEEILGSPMLCDGTLVGFVMMCYKTTLVFTSSVTIRPFLLSLVNSSYLPMVFMDLAESTKKPGRLRKFQLVEENKGTHGSIPSFAHTTSVSLMFIFLISIIINRFF